MQKPIEFTIAIDEFDASLLSEGAMNRTSEAFKMAVAHYYTEHFEPIGGETFVVVNDDEIHVQWVPNDVSQNPFGYIMSLLQEGELAQALPLLDFFLKANPDDTDVLYNLGMALSDLGRLDDAKKHLQHLLEIQPEHGGGLVALGVAHQRSRESQQAIVVLERAIKLDRTNGYALRNLGSIFGGLGKHEEAERHFRAAYELMPHDQRSVFGLAQTLERSGDKNKLSEADQLYVEAIKLDSDSQIGGLAREARSKMAEGSFQRSASGGIRMDAVMYLSGALEKFSKMTKQQIQTVTFEIAMQGMNGLSTNDPAQKYTLRSLPGNYSGLHMICLEYVGMKEIEAGIDIGFDLSKEYEMAKQLLKRDGKSAD